MANSLITLQWQSLSLTSTIDAGLALTQTFKAFLSRCRHCYSMLKLFFTFAVMILCALRPAFSQEDLPRACIGQNLLEQMQQSDPQQHRAILDEAAVVPNRGAIWWKIEKSGIAKPSWLLGTMHVTDKRVIDSAEKIRDELATSDILLVELSEIADKRALATKFASLTDKLQMPEGRSLWDLVPDPDEPAIRYHPSVAMMPDVYLSRLQPWVVLQSISVPICEMMRQTVKVTLDEAVAKIAIENNVELRGLETVEEQINVLSSQSLEDQAKGLIAHSKVKISSEDIFATMIDLYLQKNITALMPMMMRAPGVKEQMEQETAKKLMFDLIDKRNRIMFDRSLEHVQKGGAFIAVGALHLPGETGLVQLLLDAGYTVTPADD
jgi:uncharacterized protein